MTYKVGSEGITLTEATHVIPLETWWNNAVPNQAIHRDWRLGQKNEIIQQGHHNNQISVLIMQKSQMRLSIH